MDATEAEVRAIAKEVAEWMKQGESFHPALKKVLNRYQITRGYNLFAKAVGKELGSHRRRVPRKYPVRERKPHQLTLNIR
ncbi:MAG: hypothetical protein A2591_00540 [Candidatus Yonathbacteria bacterium RIFOXYD1_FULL_52_36]|uniref:Uncharacterized protein n=1 Tax=Candidatus Yonathbacteria bacterium RIFOXYD1_FULL_52_36 TaxID=1802730 RepID=A0A1G2SMB8_9BACT|nr:MAG: hypothetical protein A2591_00540 [Candidatus Yonathbacteria bacterium RIFOXYD1_FULL_52_36]